MEMPDPDNPFGLGENYDLEKHLNGLLTHMALTQRSLMRGELDDEKMNDLAEELTKNIVETVYENADDRKIVEILMALAAGSLSAFMSMIQQQNGEVLPQHLFGDVDSQDEIEEITKMFAGCLMMLGTTGHAEFVEIDADD